MNSGGEERFMGAIRDAAGWVRALAPQKVTLVHHNDADGLTAGACLLRTFERMGARVRRVALEKPFPEVLTLLFEDQSRRDLFVITDFGSGMIETIARLQPAGTNLLLLDHHKVVGTPPETMKVVNCRLFRVDGDTECSAATTCALFAEGVAAENEDLIWLGVVGATGDHQISPRGDARGLNRTILGRALGHGSMHRGEGGELAVRWEKSELPLGELVDDLNSLGAYGYYQGGSDIAVKGLIEGFDARYRASANTHAELFRSSFERVLDDPSRLHEEGALIWFELDPSYSHFGMKAVGLACEHLVSRAPGREARYVLGIQPVNTAIPGFGTILEPALKISMRVTDALREEIREGRRAGLDEILRAATEKVGGFIDACHALAAATTISPLSLDPFMGAIREMVGVDS